MDRIGELEKQAKELVAEIEKLKVQQKPEPWFIAGASYYLASDLKYFGLDTTMVRNSANLFRSEKYVKRISPEIQLHYAFLQWKEQFDNVELDWNAEIKPSYLLLRDDGKLEATSRFVCKFLGAHVFSSDDKAWQCYNDLKPYFDAVYGI